MKILVFHQPFPMGNYKVSTAVADHLSTEGHDVYVLEQLNGRPCSAEYMQQILDIDFDLVYYEMLDHETFKIIEQMKCQRILLHASGGVLGDYNAILDYKGKWYDKIFTNSKMMLSTYTKSNIIAEHFEFFHCALKPDELVKDTRYQHQCVFLGMGFNRLTDPQYHMERELYFHDQPFDFNVYGNGWQGYRHWRGVLPALDIGRLYSSAKCGVAIIAKGQREHGMINNRYTEMAASGCPIITYNYDTIDWFGADKYLNFISSADEFRSMANAVNDPAVYEDMQEKASGFKLFIDKKHHEFFERLNTLICK